MRSIIGFTQGRSNVSFVISPSSSSSSSFFFSFLLRLGTDAASLSSRDFLFITRTHAGAINDLSQRFDNKMPVHIFLSKIYKGILDHYVLMRIRISDMCAREKSQGGGSAYVRVLRRGG